MPQASALFQSPLLSQIAVDFKNEEYIADKILTPVQVPKMFGQYLLWDSGVTFKLPKTEMAQNAVANMLELAASKQSFSLVTHALQVVVDELEREQAPESQIEAMKVAKLVNALLLQREIDVAAALTNVTTFAGQTTDLSSTGQWSHASSLPINAVQTAHTALGRKGNTFVAGADTIARLRVHPQILEALQFTASAGLATLDQLARLFEVDRVLEGRAKKDTAGEGLTASKSLIWQESGGGGMAMLCYVDRSPPSPLMDQPTLGYLPTMGGGSPTTRIYRHVDPNVGTGGGVTRIKGETTYKPLISAPTMGYLWTSVLT